ncbi:MAG TPA: FAD-binding oxidoreductase [Gemmatimonadaceae bacterium]|nr:FAD-binding oxidoreductase [Gemmatimonadaceae bacterium]
MPIDWVVLAAELEGQLILPGNPVYDLARQPFNARVDQHPAAVARCLSEADVAACVRFGARFGVQLTVRSGGHGAEGFCSRDNELMIDLSAMQKIEVDLENKVVHVGGGCFWGMVDIATYPRGLAAPGGGCAEVGVGGLSQGGGFGPIARSHGLTIDNILEARVVTARDQRVVIASPTSEPDLFWALRGGGGGNFGVVTRFTYQLHEIGRAFTAGTLPYNWGADTKSMFQFYRNWMNSGSADNRLTFLPLFAMTPDGQPLGALSTFYNGDADEGLAYITQIMTAANMPLPANVPPGTPLGAALAQNLGPCTLPAYTGTESTTAWPGSGQYWRSGFLQNDFPDAAIDTFMSWFEKAPKTQSKVPATPMGHGASKAPDLTFGFIESLGGAIADVGPTDTAFFWRDQLFSFSFIGIYPSDDPGMQQATAQWADDFRTAMAPYMSGGVYVNYMQDNLLNWQTAYYGDNYPRLRHVKATYDPDHLFAFPQDLAQAPTG